MNRMNELERLAQAAFVMAPGSASITASEPIVGLEKTQEWFRNQSAAYLGQWVAVRDGVFLGSARTLAELKQALGVSLDRQNTVFSKVL